MDTRELRLLCERAYAQFHDPALISPDPLEVVRSYSDASDVAAAGLICSSLALGRVELILRAIRDVQRRLALIDASPARAIEISSRDDLRGVSDGFVYRFFDSGQLLGLLLGIRSVLRRYGSIESCVARGVSRSRLGDEPGERLLQGLTFLVDALGTGAEGRLERSILLSRPSRKSACKRLLLYARWMVRRDEIDPGIWSVFAPSDLLMPVDTHVLKLARRLGMTTRGQASLAVSREITTALRLVDPADPIRFDFCLTRPGIHPMLNEHQWLASLTR